MGGASWCGTEPALGRSGEGLQARGPDCPHGHVPTESIGHSQGLKCDVGVLAHYDLYSE